MRPSRLWVRLASRLVPRDERAPWTEEWLAELTATSGSMTHAWGALADAWFLRTEGWTMHAVWRDVRAAVKGLARRPLFTALAGSTLAVGIGVNAAIYTVVDGVLLDPLPFPESERLVSYNHEAPGLGVNVPVVPHSEAMYLHYLESAHALESFAVYTDDNVNLLFDGEPRRLSGRRVTQGYFDVMGVHPLLGRGFAPGEDRPGAEPVAVLGHPLWEEAFGADRSVVGTLVEMDGVQRRVLGVMPPGAALSDEELWVPLVIDDAEPEVGSLGLIGVGRLARGTTIASAGAEMQDLLGRFAEANPDELPPGVMERAGLAADVKPLKDVFVQGTRQALWISLGSVAFVVLIACANVANLFLARAESRLRERAVRAALGASRLDVARQYLAESLVLAGGGGALGLALAAFGVRGLLALAPAELPRALEIGIDGSVLAFTGVVSAAAGLVLGLLPSVSYGGHNLSNALKDGGRASTTGPSRHRVRSGLVVAQVALALVLLVEATLMARSFAALRDVDPGFEPAGVLTFSVALPGADYPEPRRTLEFHRRLAARLAALPGVEAAGSIDGLPLAGSKNAGPMEPEDRPFPEGELAPIVERRRVTPGYFDAMRIAIVEGRGLEWDDRADGFRGVVVSEALASALWPGESPVGRRIRNQGSEHGWKVVGVAEDVRFDDVRQEALPLVYPPAVDGAPGELAASRFMDVVVRTGGDPREAVAGAREALRAVDPRLPMIRPRAVDSVVGEAMGSTSFSALLLGIAAGIALLLGTVGLYAVVSYMVGRRTHEIGVRLALGAPAGRVLRAVVGQGLRLTAVGSAIGLAVSWAGGRVLTSMLYGVTTTDPLAFVAAVGPLAATAALATWIPARRAARVDPVEALKAE